MFRSDEEAAVQRADALPEIYSAFADAQMLFHRAAAIGDAHLAAAAQIHLIEEADDADRKNVGMVDGKAPSQTLGMELPEIIVALFQVMAEILHLGVLRFRIHVLQKQRDALLLRDAAHPAEAREGGFHARLAVAGKMIAGMDHDPAGAQALGGDLRAHQLDRLGAWPDEHQPGRGARAGEVRPLR